MMSVVSDFGKLRKYNLESLLGLNDSQPIKKVQDDNKNSNGSTTNTTQSEIINNQENSNNNEINQSESTEEVAS